MAETSSLCRYVLLSRSVHQVKTLMTPRTFICMIRKAGGRTKPFIYIWSFHQYLYIYYIQNISAPAASTLMIKRAARRPMTRKRTSPSRIIFHLKRSIHTGRRQLASTHTPGRDVTERGRGGSARLSKVTNRGMKK